MCGKWKWSLVGPLTFGCAAGSMMIKPPVEQKCSGYGLKGCGELVDGVVLYVDGDKPGALHKLKEAAAKNSPAQIRPFAKALKQVIPGDAGAEIAEILSGEIAAESDAAAPVQAPLASQTTPTAPPPTAVPVSVRPPGQDAPRVDPGLEHVELALAAPVDPSRLLTDSIVPQREPTKTVCEVAGANSTCVRKGTGPFVVTDAVTPLGCKTDLFIGASDYTGKMNWIVQTNSPGFHGARFLLRSDQWLTVAARGVPTTAEGDDRCIVTWAGFRPRMVPLSLGTSPE